MSSIDVDVVDRIIRARKTTKIMLSPELVKESDTLWTDDDHEALKVMIEGAAWAPFHRRADETEHRAGSMSAPMPWRFHVLEAQACGDLIEFLHRRAMSEPESKWTRAWQSKIKNMLAACGALVQATWLPDLAEPGCEPAMTTNNIEHVAAASAAIQNLLLAAEARGWRSYWSSGGILRDPDVFSQLGMGASEALLGSIFLAPAVHEKANQKAGGLREERRELASWVRWV